MNAYHDGLLRLHVRGLVVDAVEPLRQPLQHARVLLVRGGGGGGGEGGCAETRTKPRVNAYHDGLLRLHVRGLVVDAVEPLRQLLQHARVLLVVCAASVQMFIITLLKSVFLYFLCALSRFAICSANIVHFCRIGTAHWPIGARCVNVRLREWTTLMT